jgi:hypothetical protein
MGEDARDGDGDADATGIEWQKKLKRKGSVLL